MTHLRVLRDDALGMLPLFWLNGALVASVALGAVTLDALRRSIPASPELLFLAGWLGIAVYFAAGRTRRRASGLGLVLPLSARALWVAHIVAVLLAGTILAAGPALVIASHARVPGIGRAIPLGLPPLALFTRLLCAVGLTALLLEVPKLRLARAPTARGWAAWTALILLGVPALVILLGRLGSGWLAAVPLAAALVGVAIYHALPGGFALVPREAAAPRRRRAGAGEADASVELSWAGRALAHPFLAASRLTSIGAKEWLMVPLIAVVGVVAGGGLGWLDLEGDLMDYRTMFAAMVLYMLITGIPLRLARLHQVDALPLPRRLVFLAVLAPYLALFLASYGIGSLGAARWMARAELVALHEYDDRIVIGVPSGQLRIAWDGAPPVMAAPWGESHRPVGVPLVRGGRPVAYSPYRTPRESSPDYVAWQAARALEGAYVARVSWQEVHEHYLTVRPDGSVGVVPGGLTYRRDHPGLRARDMGPRLPLVLLLGVVPLFLLLAVLLRYFRAGVSDRRRLVAYYAVLALALALWVVPVVAALSGLAWSGVVVGGHLAMAAAWVGGTAVRTAGLWALVVGLVVTSYLIAEARFRRMEFSSRPLKLTLLDWSADAE